MFFDDAIDHFLAYLQTEKGLADNTVTSYGRDLTKLFQFLAKKSSIRSMRLKSNISSRGWYH